MSVPSPSDRRALLAQARQQLLTHGWPRVQASLIVAAAGACGFLVSVLLLWTGVDAMAWRYAIAASAGYVAFLGLVGAWVRWHRDDAPGVDPGLDLLLDAPLPRGTSTAAQAMLEGGASGGGGGGASFDGMALYASSPAPAPPLPGGTAAISSEISGGGTWLGGLLDGEDVGFILLAAACAGAGLVAITYVVYAAPILLAEVALDAALLGALYRRLRREDTRHWSRGLVRGTWVAALIVVLSAAGVGYFLQRAVPEARSIGGVVAGLTSDRDMTDSRQPITDRR